MPDEKIPLLLVVITEKDWMTTFEQGVMLFQNKSLAEVRTTIADYCLLSGVAHIYTLTPAKIPVDADPSWLGLSRLGGMLLHEIGHYNFDRLHTLEHQRYFFRGLRELTPDEQKLELELVRKRCEDELHALDVAQDVDSPPAFSATGP